MTPYVALRLGRVSNLPTVWTNVVAAAVLTGAPVAPGGVVAVALACSLFYVGGMFLNDAFDRAFDARMRPERPIPTGLVGAREVFVSGFGLLTAGLVVVGVSAWAVLDDPMRGVRFGAALAAAIVLYDAWHKANPAAPLLMGLCRVLVYLTTAATLTRAVSSAVAGGALVLLAYLVGLTYVARRETVGSVQNLWPLACLGVPFVIWSRCLQAGFPGIALYLGAVGWVVACVSHLGWRARVDVPRAVVGLIAGIALVDGMAMASSGAIGLALAAVGCFGMTLGLQRWVPGT